MSKTVKYKVSDVIDFSKSKTNGSKFTKTFIQEHKGLVPVYGASLVEDEVGYGYVADNLSEVRYFDDCLTWNIDGSTGIFFRKGHFSLSEKVIPLIVFEELKNSVDLIFLKYSIMFSKEFKEFGFSNKAGKGRLADIEISFPVLSNGDFDLETQKLFAKQYQNIEMQKKILLTKIEELKRYKVIFDTDESITYKIVELNDMVTHCNGNAKYTKEWCNSHSGNIPVYSANNKQPFAYSDKADYNGVYLTYSKNGCAGYITIIDGNFSINGDRCVVKLNDGFEKIDLHYLKYFLEPIFRKNIKGRIGINGKNEYTKINSTMIKKLNITVPIPINSNGEYDLEMQKELARKYATIETIKDNIYKQIKELTDIVIE